MAISTKAGLYRGGTSVRQLEKFVAETFNLSQQFQASEEQVICGMKTADSSPDQTTLNETERNTRKLDAHAAAPGDLCVSAEISHPVRCISSPLTLPHLIVGLLTVRAYRV